VLSRGLVAGGVRRRVGKGVRILAQDRSKVAHRRAEAICGVPAVDRALHIWQFPLRGQRPAEEALGLLNDCAPDPSEVTGEIGPQVGHVHPFVTWKQPHPGSRGMAT
jgi:hypothetical protein